VELWSWSANPANASAASPVEARQHDVEDDEVGREVPGELQPGLAVLSDVDLVPVTFEAAAQQVEDVRFVVDDEDCGH
jgi:hypothetical protein